MNERWVPVVSAVVGLAGGMGGAFIGGYVANEGQVQRFENERAAQIQDARVEADVEYLEEIANWHFHGGIEDDIITAEARVSLLSTPLVREASKELRDAALVAGKEGATAEEWETYDRRRNAFIDLAQQEIDQ